MLFNLVSNNTSGGNMNSFNKNLNNINVNNYEQAKSSNRLYDFLNYFNYNNNFCQSVEKHFQKEVVKYTIENFCSYLKENGYAIVKTSSIQNNCEVRNNNINENISFSNNNNNNNKNSSIAGILDHMIMDSDLKGEVEYHSQNEEDSTNKLYSQRKMKEVNCPHADKKHYAKNMCNSCYHKQGRSKKAWLCPHTYKIHYARGKCRNCYLNFYHKVS
jgi:hypothetical protein